MPFKTIDPENITTVEGGRIVVRNLLNFIEDIYSRVLKLEAEIQTLRDENNRLKGEQGRPDISGNKDKNKGSGNISSEKERKKPVSWAKSCKNPEIEITREEPLQFDKSKLPSDCLNKGYEEVIFQDIRFNLDNVKFIREKFYSPSERKTYLAPLPPGYEGQFGPGIKSFIISQYYGCNISEGKILEFLANLGIKISSGQIAKMVQDHTGEFKKEKDEILKEGLKSTPWQHIDDTGTRVDGKNRFCHILCNPYFVSYSTQPRKDRLTVLDVLLGNTQERGYRLDDLAYTLMKGFKIPDKFVAVLNSCVPRLETMTEELFFSKLNSLFSKIGPQQRTRILEACAISAYHAQTGYPIISMLICDDAPQFKHLTSGLSLCWVHDGRHYKKLEPAVEIHRKILDDFITEYWKYYDKLLAWKEKHDLAVKSDLEKEFDKLFGQKTGYEQLDERIQKTFSKKEYLLQVQDHPGIPLNNNPAELAARARVRKRDVSFGPRSEKGVESWDIFMSIAETAKKLGVSFLRYIHDRISGARKMRSLSELLAAKARGATQNFSVNSA